MSRNKAVMLPPPDGAESEVLKDGGIFDGIDDIYNDLEARPPPPPPSSRADIAQAQLNVTSSTNSTSIDDSSIGINMNGGGNTSFDTNNTEMFVCGVPPQSAKLGIKLGNLVWDTLIKSQCYADLNEEIAKRNAQLCPEDATNVSEMAVAPTDDSLIDNEIKTKIYVSNEAEASKPTKSTTIPYPAEKKQQSFWSVLGQRKCCGISYRMLVLIGIVFFNLMLLIILLTYFNGRNTGEKADISTQIVGAPSIEGEPVDTNAEDKVSELLVVCSEEGVLKEDGVILTGGQVLERGEYFCSPSKSYLVAILDDFVVIDIPSQMIVWSAGAPGAVRTILGEDGNMFIENAAGDILWNTGDIPGSNGVFNPQLVFWENNEGLIALQHTPIVGGVAQSPHSFWMGGNPRYEECEDCSDLQFPVRGAFYEPTFDSSGFEWQDANGNLPWHYPSLGYYSSSDPAVVTEHIEALEYGNIELGIASWFGSGTNFDRSRITMLLDETNKQDANLKWTISYEVEQNRGALSTEEIESDLRYLNTYFSGHKSWARIDGKPVIFVNSELDCEATERWMSGAADDWYVVMKFFDRYDRCEFQPDSWYNNEINIENGGVDVEEGFYYHIAPGHWVKGGRRPELERLRPGDWCQSVLAMEESTSEQWHLISSFNDSDQGSSIQPSLDWRSETEHGYFLDCLHDPQMF